MKKSRALRARYAEIIALMEADPARYPLYFAPSQDGGFHVEPLPGGGWTWQVTARGCVHEEARFIDDDALLFRIACDVAAAEGSAWQASHPAPGKDPRRVDFARRLELVGRISPAWRVRLAEELAQWLLRHPYVDRPAEPVTQRGSKQYLGLLVIAAPVGGWAAAHIPLWQLLSEQDYRVTEGLAVSTRINALCDPQNHEWRMPDCDDRAGRLTSFHGAIYVVNGRS